ncbi:pentaheme c-type cytochrome TorC [Laribacter hongkongensis]|uniref:Cytochrome c-type protein n=1 Tax=Laribacter hongkongensis TaxID=168471 RepID=A0ABD4ST32_9NEIS|nr:pentaheme c-type cytochrome TorC [Laribacter hongkongensis]MCG9026931.1 pentaheme c-type cytochrome TorC [Laribacter hongkongensis]MCG9032015.1 pentaheme c-type cytochrome TorC [Laribacter hongkongensis]MCG9053361.1 pentaheme c-type cytochrome TorC [Laribacter hongkongensis]MCG9091533.1 pentaheme c-type cytochrome TorC [Laribacter hongkongensis]MCG9100287.1 pentaheme c-type cytochrome TorC [Laribacter hongkongensis]
MIKHIKSLIAWFGTPSRKIGLGILVTTGFVAGIVAWQAFSKAMEVTNSEAFCTGCHTMQQNLTELKGTVHWTNRTGVRARCADCHVPHDFTDKMARKMKASVEVWSHLTGKISTPESFESNRLRLAQNEWLRFRANGSKECRTCHDYSTMDFNKMRETSKQAMLGAAQRNQSCMDCHKGIAHHLPDMSNSHNPALDALIQQASGASPETGKVYFSVMATPFYLDQGLTQAAGKLEVAAPVKILKQEGNAVQVELAAWRKTKGLGRVWYSHFGKNITVAVLEKEVAQNAELIKASAGKEDPNTGLLWQEARMVGWMKKGELLNSIDPIWSMAKDSYQTSCSVCHKQPVVTHFDANTWPGLFGGMVGFTSMDKDTRTVVLKYLQNHSSDFAKGNH